MVKVIVLLPRRTDMSPEAFGQHLRETHLPLVTKLPGLRRLVVNGELGASGPERVAAGLRRRRGGLVR